MWTEKNIFEPSGCLTREAFVAFLEGKLTLAAKHAAENHIAACPFCADAIDGFKHTKTSTTNLLYKVDQDFRQKYASSKKKANDRRIWITAIAAAASVLLLFTLFWPNKQDPKTQQIALNQDKKATDLVQPEAESKQAPQSDEQIAQNSAPPASENKPYDVYKSKAQSEVSEIKDDFRIEDTEVLQSAEMGDAAPVVTPHEQMSDTLLVFEQESKVDDASNKGYLAFSDKKQKEETFKRSAAAKSTVSRQNAPSADYASYAIDEAPRFVYLGFTDFGKYIESQFPAITDSSSVAEAYIEVFIDENGKVSDARIIKGINTEADKAIMKKVKDSPRWVPGKKNGQAVKTKTNWMIRYQL
jgi:hypothetical protein